MALKEIYKPARSMRASELEGVLGKPNDTYAFYKLPGYRIGVVG